MNIEMACPGCGRKLRVAADHAGKAARCPLCNTIYHVPGPSASSLEAGAATVGTATVSLWQLKTPEGQIYGPVSREILDQWVTEGRISADCTLLNESQGIWQDAATVYPVLKPVVHQPDRIPVYDNPVIGSYQAGTGADQPGRTRILNAHRGALVLALGIMSWAIGCPVFGAMAWYMGSSDLRDMQRGTMDPRGLGLTQAGKLIGMIHSILCLIAFVAFLFVVLLANVLR